MTARTLHLALFDLCRAMFVETNPTPVKAAAALLGYSSPEVRLPLAPLSEAAQRRVETALAEWQATATGRARGLTSRAQRRGAALSAPPPRGEHTMTLRIGIAGIRGGGWDARSPPSRLTTSGWR